MRMVKVQAAATVGGSRPARAASTRIAGMAIAAGIAASAIGLALAPERAAGAPPANVAYVSTPEGVRVVDLATLALQRTIDVGGNGPRGIAITPDGRDLLTANEHTADVSVIDTTTGKVVRRIHVGKNPEFLRIDRNGKSAFVTYEPSSTGGPPKKGEAEEKGGALAEVATVDIAAGTAHSFLANGRETEGIEFSPDDRSIVVANEGNDTVAIYDKATGRLERTIDVRQWGSRPRGVKVSSDGRTWVVTLENSNNFLVFDAGFDVLKSVPTAAGPYGIAFDRDGTHVVVAAARGGVLQVFATAGWSEVASVPIGKRCWHFTFTPDDAKLIAACGRSNDLRVIDAKTWKPLATIADVHLPWGIVTWPRAAGSLDAP